MNTQPPEYPKTLDELLASPERVKLLKSLCAKFATGIRSGDTADDFFQDLMIQLSPRLQKFDPTKGVPFNAWLSLIARSHLIIFTNRAKKQHNTVNMSTLIFRNDDDEETGATTFIDPNAEVAFEQPLDKLVKAFEMYLYEQIKQPRMIKAKPETSSNVKVSLLPQSPHIKTQQGPKKPTLPKKPPMNANTVHNMIKVYRLLLLRIDEFNTMPRMDSDPTRDLNIEEETTYKALRGYAGISHVAMHNILKKIREHANAFFKVSITSRKNAKTTARETQENPADTPTIEYQTSGSQAPLNYISKPLIPPSRLTKTN